MRSLAVSLALALIGCATAAAGPFDELSSRLDAYEQQPPQRQQRQPSAPANRSGKQSPAGARQVSHAEPMPAEGEVVDEGSIWEEPLDGYGDMGGCDSCDACGPCGWGCEPFGFYARAEYLQWWVRGSNTPALVTTSPTGTPVGSAGVLPTASVLFGNERMNTTGRSGGRFTAGYWFNECQPTAIEDTFFFLGNVGQVYANTSGGSPILARPFFNVDTSRQDAVLVAYPNTITGSIAITSSSQVWGNEVNLRRAMYFDDCKRVDVLAGWRYFQLNEWLNVNTNSTSLNPESGTQFNILDSFTTKNMFNGGQLGMRVQYFNCRWRLDLLGKIALGAMSQKAVIDGSTTQTQAGSAAVTNSGGILALGTNSGTHTQTQFSVIPEFNATLNYELGPCWNVNVGYTILVVTNVLRPGDQINTNLDPNQFPPPVGGPFTQPSYSFNSSDVWIQGVSVGLERTF